jgi:hypothetical protein
LPKVNGILLIEKPAPGRLSAITERLRKEAAKQNFSRQDLQDAIEEIRARKSA